MPHAKTVGTVPCSACLGLSSWRIGKFRSTAGFVPFSDEALELHGQDSRVKTIPKVSLLAAQIIDAASLSRQVFPTKISGVPLAACAIKNHGFR